MKSQTFEQWYAACNRICIHAFGMGVEDFADGPSADSYESGESPREYVFETLPEYDDRLRHFLEES